MSRFFVIILTLAGACAWAGDARFNGRWNITGYSSPRNRAWWLEITGAETSTPGGKFVTAYNGDMNKIDEISIQEGELRFGFFRRDRPQVGVEPKTTHLIYKARLVDGKLEGTFETEGQNRAAMKWVGVPAPTIKDRDDGTWREDKPLALFNGKDLSGWHALETDKELGWSVENGVLASSGKGVNIVSDRKFWNFKLHLEFKVMAHSNSGVGLRGRYEIQVLADYGRPAGTHNSGALYARIAPSENASKPPSEWQAYDITLVGRQLTVVLNGKKVIDKGEVEGLTAIAIDANEAEPGPLFLQGDHGAVEFRNIVMIPLVR